MSDFDSGHVPPRRKYLKWVVLSVIFVGFISIFYGAILTPQTKLAGKNRPVPTINMPMLLESGHISGQDIISNAPVLVNIWASWCVPCREEHALLQRLKQEYGVKIIGINYKDSPENAKAFLEKHGNPYVKNGADESGIESLKWGLSGVPETFVINKNGQIIYKYAGGLTEKTFPLFVKLLKERGFLPQ